jgi:3-isopropylmalate dehydrogenase
VVQQGAREYPDVTVEHQFVDATAMKLIQNPRSFDVVLTGNLFGDILTDEASQIASSMGMLASASIGDSIGLYEPIHGSAHDITGKGIANPLASILSAALLLDISFGLKEESETVIKAVEQTLKQGYRTADIADHQTPEEKILNTSAMGAHVVKNIKVVINQPA